jgi:large subunit ribosomal protein L15
MKIHHLKPAEGAHRKKTRKGRGEAAGKGKTAGRGTKGTGARGTVPAGFEGGQMPLQRRLPKLPGFTPRNRVEFATVNVATLDAAFDDGDAVTPDALRAKGLIRRGDAPVKVLGNGELSKQLTVSAHAFSASAEQKITAGGGSTEVLSRRPAPSTSA